MHRAFFFMILMGASFLAGAKEPCYQGYDSRKCLAEKAVLQKKLDLQFAADEARLILRLKDYEPGFIQDAVQSVRRTNIARERFMDAECQSDPLKDGMSFKDAGVIADACMVEWRERLLKSLAQAEPAFAGLWFSCKGAAGGFQSLEVKLSGGTYKGLLESSLNGGVYSAELSGTVRAGVLVLRGCQSYRGETPAVCKPDIVVRLGSNASTFKRISRQQLERAAANCASRRP